MHDHVSNVDLKAELASRFAEITDKQHANATTYTRHSLTFGTSLFHFIRWYHRYISLLYYFNIGP